LGRKGGAFPQSRVAEPQRALDSRANLDSPGSRTAPTSRPAGEPGTIVATPRHRAERVTQRRAVAAATPPLRLFVCIETGDWPLHTREGKPQRKAKNACLRATKLDERALRPLVAHPSYLFVRKSENGQRFRGEPVMKRGP
jgi:hypothetical protein